MPSGSRNWFGGWLASWLIPYRKPSPTLVADPVTDARFTVSASAADAFWARASKGVASARTAAAITGRRLGLGLIVIESSFVSAPRWWGDDGTGPRPRTVCRDVVAYSAPLSNL